jgi:hypothetical protein
MIKTEQRGEGVVYVDQGGGCFFIYNNHVNCILIYINIKNK